MKSSSLLKKDHLFRCARITRFNVLPEYACAREFIARLAPGTFLIRLREMLFVGCVGFMLCGCAAAVTTDGEIGSAENPETSFASCPISQHSKRPAMNSKRPTMRDSGLARK